MLKRFETFVPKNLDKRQEDLKHMQEKEEYELKELAIKLQKIVNGFKDIKVEDEREQWFIDQFKNCKIKIDYKEYPNSIFFFDKKDKYIGDYDSKDGNFFTNWHTIWNFLVKNNYSQIVELVKNWTQRYFKLKHVTTNYSNSMFIKVVEQHFKHK